MSEPRLTPEREERLRQFFGGGNSTSGVLLAEIDRLRAELVAARELRDQAVKLMNIAANEEAQAKSQLATEQAATRELLKSHAKDYLARCNELTRIRDATGHVIHKTAEECVGCGCFSATAEEAVAETLGQLRAALSDRDRQLAELREACQPFADYVAHLDADDHPDDRHAGYYHSPGIKCGDFRRLAALLPPTPKEDDRAAKE